MKFFNRLLNVFKTKVNRQVNKLITARDNYEMAATTVINNIHQLETRRVSLVREKANLERTKEKHAAALAKAEATVKHLVETDASKEVLKPRLVMALQLKHLVTAIDAKQTNIVETTKSIEEGLVALGDRLEGIKTQLEILRLTEETDALGITLPEDVVAAVGYTGVDVDHLIREVDVFVGQTSNTTVSELDIEQYLAEFKKS